MQRDTHHYLHTLHTAPCKEPPRRCGSPWQLEGTPRTLRFHREIEECVLERKRESTTQACLRLSTPTLRKSNVGRLGAAADQHRARWWQVRGPAVSIWSEALS